MQILSQYLYAFGVLFFTLMCTPQNIFAINPQSPNPLLTSKDHKKKFALRGCRGKPGRQGNSGSGSGTTGATGPQGPQGPTGPAGAESASLAGINGYAFKSSPPPPFNPGSTIVTFNGTTITDGVSYNGTNTFTINTAGQYRIYYMINLFAASGFTTADSIQTILQINGISQPATIVRITPAGPTAFHTFTMYEGIFTLNVNDQIRVLLTTTRLVFQVATDGATFVISKLD